MIYFISSQHNFEKSSISTRSIFMRGEHQFIYLFYILLIKRYISIEVFVCMCGKIPNYLFIYFICSQQFYIELYQHQNVLFFIFREERGT